MERDKIAEMRVFWRGVEISAEVLQFDSTGGTLYLCPCTGVWGKSGRFSKAYAWSMIDSLVPGH